MMEDAAMRQDALQLEALLVSREYLYTLFHKLLGGTPDAELLEVLLGDATADVVEEYAGDNATLRGLCAFLRETVDLYATVLDDQKLALNLDLPKGAVVFSGHRGRLQRLLGNLLDNAIKFTPAGGVITLSLVQTASAIVLRISDTGCGIALGEIPHVFSRFWRSDSSRSLPGNGLGLALAKAIVTSYAGTISCESTPGKGSTFTIAIPIVK